DRGVTVAAEQLVEFLVADARQHARVGNLVTVEMQNRQHRTIRRRAEKLVRMPARREWAGLRLTITDDCGDDEIGIVVGRAERVAERITKFAAFMYGTWCFRRDVTGNAARKGELFE